MSSLLSLVIVFSYFTELSCMHHHNFLLLKVIFNNNITYEWKLRFFKQFCLTLYKYKFITGKSITVTYTHCTSHPPRITKQCKHRMCMHSILLNTSSLLCVKQQSSSYSVLSFSPFLLVITSNYYQQAAQYSEWAFS